MAKTKSKMSTKNKMYILSIVFLIISIVCGITLYMFVTESLKTTPVVITNRDIKAGKMISEGDVSVISVGKQGIQSNIITSKANVVGKYALRDMKQNEYVFSTSLTDDYVKRLSEKAKYGAIAVPIDNLQAVTGDIKENDFVGAYISVDIKKNENPTQNVETASDVLPDVSTALIYSEELTALRVLGLYDGSSNKAGVASASTDENGNTSYKQPSMIVFDAMPAQRTLLIQAIDNGKIRLIIHPEYVQRGFRKIWGLEGADSVDTPQDQALEEETIKNREEREKIEQGHKALTNSPEVNTYVQKVKDQNGGTQTTIDALNPQTGTNIEKPVENK